jgi:hypothetical protein
MNVQITRRYKTIIEEIGTMDWPALDRRELMSVCRAYYYFSRQFVEAVHIACALYPEDELLSELRAGECDTDNLSPYPGFAEKGEKMDHDEFMRRVIVAASLDEQSRNRVDALGREYSDKIAAFDELTRAMSLSTYEDGGLEVVFRAMLTARDWDEPSLGGFRHFLSEHIRLDSGEHGGLCRHLVADDRVLPLWVAFRDLLVAAAPRLSLRARRTVGAGSASSI